MTPATLTALGGVHGAVRNPISTNAVYPQGARNVLQLLLAHIFKDEVELARGISLHPRRYANSTRLSQAFQASRDIHSIPEDVVVFDNDLSHMDADTKFDAPIRWDLGIPFGHAVLHFGRTTQGVDDP